MATLLGALVATLLAGGALATAKMVQKPPSGTGTLPFTGPPGVDYRGLDSKGGVAFALVLDSPVLISEFTYSDGCSRHRRTISADIRLGPGYRFEHFARRAEIEGILHVRRVKRGGRTGLVYGKVTGTIEQVATRGCSARSLPFTARPTS